MKYDNEQKVKDKLVLDKWSNISRDQIITFATMMPEIDKDVAMKIIEQLPEFRQILIVFLNFYDSVTKTTVEANSNNQASKQKTFSEIRNSLLSQIENENATFEEKKYWTEKSFDLMNKQIEDDDKNKEFLTYLYDKAIDGAVYTILGGLLIVGGAKLIKNPALIKYLKI